MIGAFFTTLCFAITPVFANRAAHRLGSAKANAWRLLVATLVLGLWAHGVGRGFGGPAVWWFFAGGLAGFGVGGLAMFQSLPRLGSNLSTLIVQCGSAVVAAGLEWGWLGTQLSAWQVVAIGATLSGVLLGLLPRSLPRALPTEWATGLGWAFLSAAGQGAGAVLSRKAFMVTRAAGEYVDAGTASYQRAVAGLLVAALALLIAHLSGRDRPRETGRAWPWVLANAASGPLLGVIFFQWALSTTPAGIVQAVVASAPLLTIPLASKLEGGWPRRLYYSGAALAVTGVAGLFLLA